MAEVALAEEPAIAAASPAPPKVEPAPLDDLKARIEETRRRIRQELEQPFISPAPARPVEDDWTVAPVLPATSATIEAPPVPEPEPAPLAEAEAFALSDESLETSEPPAEEEAIDYDAMQSRIEVTRSRLKAKAFDAMMTGESALLGRDHRELPSASEGRAGGRQRGQRDHRDQSSRGRRGARRRLGPGCRKRFLAEPASVVFAGGQEVLLLVRRPRHVQRPAEEVAQVGPGRVARPFDDLQEALDLGVEVVHVVQDQRLDGLRALGRAPLQLAVMADDAVQQLLELGFGERRQLLGLLGDQQ